MLTQEEQKFFTYWQDQRLRKKEFLKKFSIGLPMAVLVVVAILVNFLSGWYKKAEMELRSDGSVVVVVLVAALAIVVFITLFSIRHQWDQNEQRYQELLQKKDQTG